MKKKISTLMLAVATLAFTGCEYDDGEIWNKVNDMDERITALEESIKSLNGDIETMDAVVSALEGGLFVTEIVETENGYRLTFSDGKTVEIENGTVAADTPVVGIRKHTDGYYYWTLTTGEAEPEWLLDDEGNMMRVTGEDGHTPVLSVDDQGYWLIDGERIETADGYLKAEGKDGDSFFKSVEQTQEGIVVVLNTTDERIVIPVKAQWSFTIDTEGETTVLVEAGKTRTLAIEAVNVEDYAVLSVTEGWKATAGNDQLNITAPDQTNSDGQIAVLAISTGGEETLIAKVNVRTPRILTHTITFEGEEWSEYVAANIAPGKTYTNQVSNLNGVQYSYPLWVDETTQLTTVFPHGPNDPMGIGFDYPWIVSSYVANSASFGDYLHDLYVYSPDITDATKGGGNNGSDNFLISYGYSEAAHPEYGDQRPIFRFADGTARTIKSLYINSTCYFFFVASNGNELSPALGDGEKVTWYATGYDADGNEIGTEEFVFATKDNFTDTWTEWDISALGPVVELRINQGGGTDNGYGYSLPAYYAVDDITVEWTE